MATCIHCKERGHRIAQCTEFHEDLMKPSEGTCGRCGGTGKFMPYKLPAVGRAAPSIEAIFICDCCSFSACTHKPALALARLG